MGVRQRLCGSHYLVHIIIEKGDLKYFMKKIKNQLSRSKNIFSDIQKILSAHQARKLMFEYNKNGRVEGMAFGLEIDGKELMFRLPARTENLARLLYQQDLLSLQDKEIDHCYQTAWANIRDWIDAQLAMVDTEMVVMGEVFLPYYVHKNGLSHFEAILKNPQLLLN